MTLLYSPIHPLSGSSEIVLTVMIIPYCKHKYGPTVLACLRCMSYPFRIICWPRFSLPSRLHCNWFSSISHKSQSEMILAQPNKSNGIFLLRKILWPIGQRICFHFEKKRFLASVKTLRVPRNALLLLKEDDRFGRCWADTVWPGSDPNKLGLENF